MSLTYTGPFTDADDGTPVNASITSTSRTYNSGELVTVFYTTEGPVGTLSIANSGTAQTWSLIGSAAAASNCTVAVWQCVMSVTQAMTVTVQGTNGVDASISVIAHAGQHATDPVPAGKVFSGTGGTDVSQAITPTSSGSCLWMAAADWSASNTFAAASGCTLEATHHSADGSYTRTLIRPTTQPRTDAAAFTIGETDTSGKIAWVAFEVQAAAGGGGGTAVPVFLHHLRQQGIA